MKLRLVLAACLVLAATLASASYAQSNRGYYRDPALHKNNVVFTSEGDLWEIGIEGGLARRLTSHPGPEEHAAFSPDGQQIAFSANYEGPTEVYTIPAGGGLPQRRTFDGGATVVGWTPDGKILFSTYSHASLPDAQLVTIDNANRQQVVPLIQAAQGTYDRAGGTLFFTRFPFQGSYAKRYKGGTAQSLWKYSEGHEAIALTADYPGTSKNAMWWKNRIYFLSDRDGTMNLWSMDENGKNLRQHTSHEGWDLQSPSLSEGKVVYQMGAELYFYDIASQKEKMIPIELPSDFDHLREHWITNPADYITSMHLSPAGNDIVLTSRGKAFVAPVKHERFVDVNPNKPGRVREGRMTADGKSLFVLSSESGEVELWKYPANGVGKGEQLTNTSKVLVWEGVPSPDGKWVVTQDKDDQLFLLNAATKQQTRIATASASGNSGPAFSYLRWSPDSRWLTFSQEAENQFSQIMLLNAETGKVTPLTSDRYDNIWASWSTDGKWIYFLSDRAINSVVGSPWGNRQPEPFFDKPYKIYALALQKNQISPFQPADELHPDAPAPTPPVTPPAPAAKPGEAAAAPLPPPPPPVVIDLDGIAARVTEVPVEPGNYSDLNTADKKLCWIDNDRSKSEKNMLQCVAIANKEDKPENLLAGVEQLETSVDGKKMLVRKKNDVWVFDTSVNEGAMKVPKTMDDAKVDLSKWSFSVIPSDEYREAFLDAWRLHRDYFYDRHMHGVNWTAMRDKYGEIIGRVRDREELSDLIAQMVSELSVLHTFVVGGDVRKGPDHVELATLGAELERRPDGNGFIVKHIYRADPDRPDKLSPLARQGVEMSNGDEILSINGRELGSGVEPGELLRNLADKQVLLRIVPAGKTATRDVVVKPITARQDRDLRYGEWELTRREMVESASKSRIGYVHLRAMGKNDIDRWAEDFSPIYTREGLIVDVRHNNGGNIDSWILERLMRKPWMYWQPRLGRSSWNMQQSFRGPVVVLCDQWTASDGEAFSEGFRRLGLGKVIGARTWGGEVWLSFSNGLADNGIASAAELGVYSADGKWLIEGHGVDPDMVVDNLPHATFEGQDAQLEAALDYLDKQIKTHPVDLPTAPKYPNKSFTVTHGMPKSL